MQGLHRKNTKPASLPARIIWGTGPARLTLAALSTGLLPGAAALDTGVHFRNDLAPTTRGSPSRITANVIYSTTSTDESVGQGTHVAGIIAGNGAKSTGGQNFQAFYGIARQASVRASSSTASSGDLSSIALDGV